MSGLFDTELCHDLIKGGHSDNTSISNIITTNLTILRTLNAFSKSSTVGKPVSFVLWVLTNIWRLRSPR
jgi:hypothetical protein